MKIPMQYIKNTFSWLMMMVLKMMKSMRARQIFFLQNDENENDLAKSQAMRARLMMTNMRRSTTQTIRGQDW